MRRGPGSAAAAAGSENIAGPVLLVVLVLLIGGTVYLWRQRYMRRKTAYVIMAILFVALIVAGYQTYQDNL